MGKRRGQRSAGRRRGTIVVWTTVSMTTLLAFCTLAIDVGHLYAVRAELQNAADAAAMAAASQLSAPDGGYYEQLSLSTARRYASLNKVLGEAPYVEASDLEFGRAVLDGDRYLFVPGSPAPDAVRVTVRRTAGARGGPVPLIFAPLFGKYTKDMVARAAAMLIPRDIAVVADLSASHTDDSELRHYDITEINLWEVWAALPRQKGNNGVGNGLDPPPPGNPGGINDGPGTGPGNPGNRGGNPNPGANPINPHDPQLAGPLWGLMYSLGWGTLTVDQTYSPSADPGLAYLPYNRNWSNGTLEAALTAISYSPDEIDAIMSRTYDRRGAWRYRVATAMGLAVWRSGMPGGKWEADGLPPGNGNRWVGGGELDWSAYPFDSGSWLDYIGNYTNRTWTHMYHANPQFRYRYGAKTFINYLLERRPRHDQTPELADAPVQPMQAVKDAVSLLTEIIDDLDSDDRLSLEAYDTWGHHEVNLTDDYYEIAERLNEMQGGHYGGWTNMGAGIERAIAELTGSRSRESAVKVMFLLTDGKANVTESGVVGDYEGGPAYALAAAADAVAAGIQIYCVTVGADADRELMQQIAAMGHGEEFHAEGSIEQYTAQLQDIFRRLGGTRPVVLIE